MTDPFNAINAQVLADFPAWLKQPEIEGCITFPYCDSVGVVTAGAGTAFFSVADMQVPQWDIPDGSMADAATVAASYDACRALYVTHPPKTLAAGAYAHCSVIRLSQKTIDFEIVRWVRLNMPTIINYFADFQYYSEGVQMGILDLAYNEGSHIFGKFPKFTHYVHALDWNGAAQECATPGQNEKRNQMRAALFLQDL